MARRYNRDSRGRFASGGGGGGGGKRPSPRGISRGTNRLTRDNSGRITSVGGDGATARGGRLRTASGKQRATQTARISGGRAAGTVTRSGARRTAAVKPRQPKMSEILGGTLRALAQADARRIREVESITGQKLRVPNSATTRATSAAPRTGRITDALGSSLRQLAQSDARMARGMADIASAATPRLTGAKASKPALKPTTRAAAAPAKPVRRQPLRGVNAAVASNPAGFKGLPVSLRARSQAGAAYRAKVNQLGKSTAASRGFNEALARGQRGGVAQSAPRTVFRQGRMSQMTLSGKVEQVRGGRIRPVGTRSSSGAIKLDRPRKRR